MHALVDGFDVSAAEVAEEIDSRGAACLTAVLTAEWLQAAQECVRSYLPTQGDHEVFVEDPADDQYAFVHRLVIDPRLEKLLESLAFAGYPRLNGDNQDIECAVRILVGPGDPGKPLWFHYDRSVVTMVIPIVIPDVGSRISGELVLCPNRRPYRRFVITNIIEKLVAQNDIYRRRFIRKLGNDPDATRVVALEPGNAYLFWGYRTYHSTFPCAPGALRVTVILHYGDVHGGNLLLTSAQRAAAGIRNSKRNVVNRIRHRTAR
jgi:hypothetical protein